jgi:CheY-like chemotaxis protein
MSGKVAWARFVLMQSSVTACSGRQPERLAKAGGTTMLASATGEAGGTYSVSCHNCQAPFDAFESQWCSCIVTERTLVCPSCLTCFCKAPPAYKRSFWRDAPPRLWDLKFAEHHAEFAPPSNPPPAQVLRPLVLLVDDEPDIQRVASRVIQSLGYGMILARDGKEGLALAKEYRPDLILSDALMPKLDGREMCGLVKDDPDTAHIRVVVMTGLYTNIKYAIEAHKKFKVDDYLTKPLEFNTLRAVLEKHLG